MTPPLRGRPAQANMLQFRNDSSFDISVWQDGRRIGSVQWTLLWEGIPFLMRIFFAEAERRKGCGTQTLQYFERMLADRGYSCVLVSAQADEDGQHFFRKLGYKDCGELDMSGFTRQSAKELFLYKILKNL